ncbi:glycosyltransferase family 8 protein [Streptomyces klenkii]|uniref:glycosyltransferase family 8 protein n=1 Tax=Streptomyces klenkii TaxID=1420899 RepID=UPI0036E52B59
MRIAIAFDGQYTSAARNMLSSLSRCLSPKSGVRISALMTDDSPSADVVEHAKSRGLDLEVVRLRRDLSDLPLLRYLTGATYARLFLPELVPDDVALYMDVDVVLMRDVTELFATDLRDRPLAAVRDMWRPNLHEALAGGGSGQFAPDAPYFNAGVMLCNLRQWRRENLTERALDWLASQDQVPVCLEQDVLNALTHGRWIELDPRWNVFPMTDFRDIPPEAWPPRLGTEYHAYRDQERRAFVLHFIGSRKPWRHPYPDTENLRRYRHFTTPTIEDVTPNPVTSPSRPTPPTVEDVTPNSVTSPSRPTSPAVPETPSLALTGRRRPATFPAAVIGYPNEHDEDPRSRRRKRPRFV